MDNKAANKKRRIKNTLSWLQKVAVFSQIPFHEYGEEIERLNVALDAINGLS